MVVRMRVTLTMPGFSEAESGICTLQIRYVAKTNHGSGQVLEKVVEYLQWHARYSHQSQYPIKEFESKIPPELALELYVNVLISRFRLMAADFLECMSIPYANEALTRTV